MKLCCFSLKRVQLLTLLLAVMLILGILMILFFFNYPSMVRERIVDELVFKNNSEALERFRTTKEIKNLRLSFYLYNVTNAQEVISNASVKIKLKEIGPFVYKELKIRDFINNNQTSGLISYKARTIYTFDRANSIADISSIYITWPNVPLLVAQDVLDNMSAIKRMSAYYIINKAIDHNEEKPFITDTVENFLFKGSYRKLFAYLQKLDIFHSLQPWPLKDNKFALLYGKNNHWNPEKDFIMTSSAGFGLDQTYRDINRYVYANGSSTLPFWHSEPPKCNKLGGTDGEFFQPFLNRSQTLEVYSADICRKLKLKYSHDYIIDGLNVYKYLLDEKELQSGVSNPDNMCYCLTYGPGGVPGPECAIDGLVDLRTCAQPNVFFSGAHFYRGSPELLTRIEGVTPPDASHEPVIYIEPNAGISVKVKMPLQFNIRLNKNGFKIFKFFQDGQPLYIPLVWIEESAELTEEQAALLKSKLLLLDSWFVSMVLGGSIVFVLVISVIGAILCIRFKDSRAARMERAAEAARPASETTPILASSITSSDTRSYTNPIVDEPTEIAAIVNSNVDVEAP